MKIVAYKSLFFWIAETRWNGYQFRVHPTRLGLTEAHAKRRLESCLLKGKR